MDKSSKKLLLFIGILVGCFALLFIGSYVYNILNKEIILTIDELHAMNLQGKLSEDEGYVYNGFSFVYYGNRWNTMFMRDETEYTLSLNFGPKSLDDVNIIGNGTIGKRDIYVAFDLSNRSKKMPYLALAAAELSVNLAKGLDILPIAACLNNDSNACYDRPIVSCGDKDKDVVVIDDREDPIVVFNNNCVVLRGKDKDILKSVDRFLYYWYDIMN